MSDHASIEEQRIDSPLGAMRLLADAHGLTGIYFVGQKYEPPVTAQPVRPSKVLRLTADWLQAYFAAQALPAAPALSPGQGTAFQREVWTALQAIPPGTTRSYGELAGLLGRAGAARAAGAAVGRNPWSVLVPCHRVTGRSGQLTGYAGGLGRKAALLALEKGQALPWRRVAKAYRTQYHLPVEVLAGEVVHWLPHPDHGEYPGWAWGQAGERLGWLPRDWFGPGAAHSVARRSYSARELDADPGDRVLELDAFGGWALLRHADHRVGWLPLSHLAPA